jgi:hypothetical protein
MNEPEISIEEVANALDVERHRRQLEQARRNSDWLADHWPQLLPQARGKFIAVGGQEAFIADTAEAARRLARSAHPSDQGILVQYVFPSESPRVYGNLRRMEAQG